MQTNLWWQKADQWLSVQGGGAKRAWGDKYVYDLNYGDSFTDVYVRQNLSNSSLNLWNLLYINYVSIKLI